MLSMYTVNDILLCCYVSGLLFIILSNPIDMGNITNNITIIIE